MAGGVLRRQVSVVLVQVLVEAGAVVGVEVAAAAVGRELHAGLVLGVPRVLKVVGVVVLVLDRVLLPGGGEVARRLAALRQVAGVGVDVV